MRVDVTEYEEGRNDGGDDGEGESEGVERG